MQTWKFFSTEFFVQECPDQVVVAGSDEDDEGEEDRKTIGRSEDEDGNDRNARQRKLNYSTKVFEGVPIIVKGDCYIYNRNLPCIVWTKWRELIVFKQCLPQKLFDKTNNALCGQTESTAGNGGSPTGR